MLCRKMKLDLGSILVISMTVLQTATGATIMHQLTGQQTYWPSNKGAVWKAPTLATDKGQWSPSKVLIPYKEQGYDMEELAFIEGAMADLSTLTGNCFSFDPLEFDSEEKYFLAFRKSLGNVPPAACSSHLGRVIVAQAVNVGQAVIAFNDENNPQGSCLKNPRDFLRILMNILGIGNEYQRSDRSQAMIFQTNYQTSLPENLQSVLDVNTNLRTDISKSFDVQSITMVDGKKYAKDVTQPLFTLKYGEVPSGAKLSSEDCRAINFMYRCNMKCNDITDFYQMITPPVPCALETKELSAHLNCWPEGHETESVTPDDITKAKGLVRVVILPPNTICPAVHETAAEWELDENNFGDEIGLINDTVAATVKFQLKKHISRGFTTAGQIRGLDKKKNEVFRSGNVTVKVNCLPRYSIPCDKAGGCSVSDTKNIGKSNIWTDIPVTEVKVVKGAMCDADKNVMTGSVLGPFEITDPEGGIPLFSSLSVATTPGTSGATSDSDQVMWQWVPRTSPAADKLVGDLVFIGEALPGPVKAEVELKFLDGQNGVGGLKVVFMFECSSLLRAARRWPA